MKILSLIFIFISTFVYASKSTVIEALGPFGYEVSYFSEERFNGIVLPMTLVERAQKDSQYLRAYQRYLAYGVKTEIEKVERRVASTPNNLGEEKLKYDVDQRLSIIGFKKGELSQKCQQVVREAVSLKMKSIVYYHPVHFSGGNGNTYKMPLSPVYGKHWRFENILNFTQTEFSNCLNLISSSGLRLHFVPHLESISTLVGSEGSEEWRLLSGIPIDNHYFHYSFGPLLTFLKENPEAFKSDDSIEVTLAAEIDPMILNNAESVLGGKRWLKDEFEKQGRSISQFFLNTNGDFFHGKELVQTSKLNCSRIFQLFSEVSALTPSMYGDKGHLKFYHNKLSIKETIKHYKDELSKMMISYCPSSKIQILEMIKSKKIGFGEFAIDPESSTQRYGDILSESRSELIFIQYWNDGIWDHLNLTDPNKYPQLRSQLLKRQENNLLEKKNP